MQKTVLFAILLLALGVPAGCMKVEAKAPAGLLRPAPPPLSAIAKADPQDKADLLRENQQLRDRLAWLQEQNLKSYRKTQSIEKEEREIRAEMGRIR